MRVAVLGAGISGLTLAWYLKSRFQERIEVHVFDRSERPGGWIHSTRDGAFLFEHGPRGCRAKGSGVETLRLADELGLRSAIITAPPAAHHRFLWMQGRLREVPSQLPQMIVSPLAWRIPWALWKDLRCLPSLSEDESIYDFGFRHFGKYVTETFLDPMTLGIFAGDIRKLSVRSCFPILWEAEQRRGSVLRGLWSRKGQATPLAPWIRDIQESALFSFREGMGQLIGALAAQLPAQLHLRSQLTGIDFHDDSLVVVHDKGKETFDYVFSALPASALATLVQKDHSSLADELRAVQARSMYIVHLGYKAPVLPKQGFGYLVPSKEQEVVLGAVWDSAVFPQQNQGRDETRITVMLKDEDDVHGNADVLAIDALKRHLQVHHCARKVVVHRVEGAIPQYEVGHSRRLDSIQSKLKGVSNRLFVTGSSFRGVGVNDCIARAKALALADFQPKIP